MSEVSYRYSFFCPFLLCWIFFVKKSLLWQNQIIIWITCFFWHILCIFFLLLPIWSTFICCYQGTICLIFSIQQVAFSSYIAKYKSLSLQMCVTLFSTSKWKQWSALFNLCVWNCFLHFVNQKHEINCRIMASRSKGFYKKTKKIYYFCWKHFATN